MTLIAKRCKHVARSEVAKGHTCGGARLPLGEKHTLIAPPIPPVQVVSTFFRRNKCLLYKHGWIERYSDQILNRSNKISFFYISESLF